MQHLHQLNASEPRHLLIQDHRGEFFLRPRFFDHPESFVPALRKYGNQLPLQKQAFEKFAVRRIVIHNENPAAGMESSRGSGLGFDFHSLRRLQKHLKVKPAALPLCALHPDSPCHQFD